MRLSIPVFSPAYIRHASRTNLWYRLFFYVGTGSGWKLWCCHRPHPNHGLPHALSFAWGEYLIHVHMVMPSLPCVHAQGIKWLVLSISLSFVCLSAQKFARSKDLGILVVDKHDHIVGSGKKLAFFLLLDARHSPWVLQILRLCRPCLLTTPSTTMWWFNCTCSSSM